MLARRPEMEDVFLALIPDYRERKEEALAARSAVRWVERLNPKTPILILAGTADWRVTPRRPWTCPRRFSRPSIRSVSSSSKGASTGSRAVVDRRRAVHSLTRRFR
jgi:hypothetical protein